MELSFNNDPALKALHVAQAWSAARSAAAAWIEERDALFSSLSKLEG